MPKPTTKPGTVPGARARPPAPAPRAPAPPPGPAAVPPAPTPAQVPAPAPEPPPKARLVGVRYMESMAPFSCGTCAWASPAYQAPDGRILTMCNHPAVRLAVNAAIGNCDEFTPPPGALVQAYGAVWFPGEPMPRNLTPPG